MKICHPKISRGLLRDWEKDLPFTDWLPKCLKWPEAGSLTSPTRQGLRHPSRPPAGASLGASAGSPTGGGGASPEPVLSTQCQPCEGQLNHCLVPGTFFNSKQSVTDIYLHTERKDCQKHCNRNLDVKEGKALPCRQKLSQHCGCFGDINILQYTH